MTSVVVLTAEEQQFVDQNNFTAINSMDEYVAEYQGTYLTESAHSLLAQRFGEDVVARVRVKFVDYSDIGYPRGYLVVIGIPEEWGERHGYLTLGVLGFSSPACPDLQAAYKEAAVRFLAAMFVKPRSQMVEHMQRVMSC